MDFTLNGIIKAIKESIVNHGIDWIITMVITFISVRFATKNYYYSVRKSTIRPIMEQGLKLILNKDIIPANAKSILVENKGRCFFRWKKYKCTGPFETLRKTICTVGGNENSTSDARSRYWGVLGLAYLLKSVVVYDFCMHQIYIYNVGITKEDAIEDREKYYYNGIIDGKLYKLYLSNKKTDRKVMFAIPLFNDKGIVGGITFDVDCEIKIETQSSNEFLINNDQKLIDMCKQLNDLGSNIINAYFSQR